MPDANPAEPSEQDDAVSRRFVEARLGASPLSEFPGELPDSLERAYAIQTASINRWPDPVAGWKVARLPVPDRERFGTERLVGPVFAPSIRRIANGESLAMPLYRGGFGAIEAEIVLEFGTAVTPTDGDYSDDELFDIVSAAYGGAEIASSPLPQVNDLGATSIISDFGSNAGVVVGPRIDDWQRVAHEAIPVTTTIDGDEVGHVPDVKIVESPFDALRALFRISAWRGIELPAGTIVSTGMITGVHDVTLDSVSRVDFGSIGHFDVSYEAFAARS